MADGRVSLFKAVSSLFEFLPESLDRQISRVAATAAGFVQLGARQHLATNIRHALTGARRRPSTALIERTVNRGFASYGEYWAEGGKLPALSVTDIASRFVLSEGEEHLRAAVALGKGVVIALPHIGSWEWGGAFLAHIGFPMTAVAEALDPPELFEHFRSKRHAIGLRIEPLDENAGTVLLHTLRLGGVVGLLCDRDIQGNGIPVDFFGERVTMPAGPATLALRTGATLLAAACYSGPGDGHHAVITAPIACEREGKIRDDVARVTQLVADELEGLIRRAPDQWHVLQPRFDS
jgi:KDO2-lipid IV(A) lauroyltransferase